MKIIIDECVPSVVKKGLPERGIVTVQEMGWAGIKNGQLLRLVSADFDVFYNAKPLIVRCRSHSPAKQSGAGRRSSLASARCGIVTDREKGIY